MVIDNGRRSIDFVLGEEYPDHREVGSPQQAVEVRFLSGIHILVTSQISCLQLDLGLATLWRISYTID